jgi:lambda repressor-like predicted transcriptional regulator
MDPIIERHCKIKAELRKRDLTLASVAEDMGKNASSLSGCCLGRFFSQEIQAEISRRINQDVLVLFKERYDKGGMPIPHKK